MRVVVAMSGGVDSTVVAGLLHEPGHEVIGVTLQLYDHGAATGRKGACCAGQDIHDARRVADRLGIPHYVIDAEDRFARAVIADFADSYAAGETPVPCVRCNQTVKFTDLTALAAGLGAERLATGHYVRRIDGPDGPELHRAADPARDQSWFLFATTRAQLAFAAGSRWAACRTSARCATMAERLGLAVADKPDSQDICFVPSGRLRRDRWPAAAGCRWSRETSSPATGAVLGRHDGVARYTVGQGKRLGAAAMADGAAPDGGGDRAWHAARGRRPARCRHDEVRLREVNWLVSPSATPLRCPVKLRARDTHRPAVVETAATAPRCGWMRRRLPAPGQACVFYDGDRVLGGGFITRA